jgi:hypothetical protein
MAVFMWPIGVERELLVDMAIVHSERTCASLMDIYSSNHHWTHSHGSEDFDNFCVSI